MELLKKADEGLKSIEGYDSGDDSSIAYLSQGLVNSLGQLIQELSTKVREQEKVLEKYSQRNKEDCKKYRQRNKDKIAEMGMLISVFGIWLMAANPWVEQH